MSRKFFTSESVGRGHPDKICDQISDLVLDEAIKLDPLSRVACEVMITNNYLIIGGEITCSKNIDFALCAKKIIENLGYDFNQFKLIIDVNKQSDDINFLVSKKENQLGAGDQGLMFGYACSQTPETMPLAIMLAHAIVRNCEKIILENKIKDLKWDMKSQVTVSYEEGTPIKLESVVLSCQHNRDTDLKKFRNDLLNLAILPAVRKYNLNENFNEYINSAGPFIIGGPQSDTGLTGRKIIVDSYGGWSRHGGGAFSGKDATKVDRSACYLARWIAKNIVAAKICKEIEIQLAYTIGTTEPVSLNVNTFNSAIKSDEEIIQIIKKCFDLSPSGIIQQLDLLKPIYFNTSVYGHFGRNEPGFTWETLDKVKELQKYAN